VAWCACAVYLLRQAIEFGAALQSQEGRLLLLSAVGIVLIVSILFASAPAKPAESGEAARSERCDQRL